MSEKYTLERIFSLFPKGICVPRIQRGYVQGRGDEKGLEIRKNFAPALVKAVFGGEELSLDFIYGVTKEQCLLPLDGQQRLSTLFLLAWLCGKWKSDWCFTYEARRIPQLFVKGLLEHPCKAEGLPSVEIKGSGWFLPIWEKDPSVDGMLQMLDALHETIGQRNRADADFGRISFLLHGIDGHSDTFDHIFRKMNARGKELSPWENMKAMLDKYLPQELADAWRDKVDGDWTECIWLHSNNDISRLDAAMEKIIRVAYARFESQNDSLWQMEKKLSGDGEGAFDEKTRVTFYKIAAGYFDKLSTIAKCWTSERAQNALWNVPANETEFWKNWLLNRAPASCGDILRMAFLAENAHDEVKDDQRRRRIILNLLDASSINVYNFVDAMKVGLDFIAGILDLETIKSRLVGYSPEQLGDEIRKWSIEEQAITTFETDELVKNGSLRFIGWTQFRDAEDISERLEPIRAAITGDEWLDFYQDLVSRIPSEKINVHKRYIFTPLHAGDVNVWKEHILTDGRFIDALKMWHDAPDTPQQTPAWMLQLVDLLRSGQVENSALRWWYGWMYLLQTDSKRSANSIRLDFNDNERKNRQLLLNERVYFDSSWPWWAKAKEDGVWYNVCDPSWWESDTPPKGNRDADGNFQFIVS
ncbi:MAG: DUF262 domain-containing protein [Victivallales bacterium]|nr:DUF262 domain-containing protein [Victivallales bacterium]